MFARKHLPVFLLLASLFLTAGIGVQVPIPKPQVAVTSTITDSAITAPPCFWVVGCIHLGQPNTGTPASNNTLQWGHMIDSANVAHAAGRCSFLIVAGDWALDERIGTEGAARDSFFATTARAQMPIYWALGNHEALASDTLLGLDPYTTARGMFPDLFQGQDWYAIDPPGTQFRVIVLQTNANVDVADTSDYRVGNPRSLRGGGFKSEDYGGITDPTSPQRLFLARELATLNGRTPIIVGHRSPTGSNASTTIRHNFGSALGSSGYYTQVIDSLLAGLRGFAVVADQHIEMLTKAEHDSTIAGATAHGIYTLQMISGYGIRPADTTSVRPAGEEFYLSYFAQTVGQTSQAFAKTSEGWADTLTSGAGGSDLAMNSSWFVSEVEANGDDWVVKTFRIFAPGSSASKVYDTGLKLMDTHRIPMDVR